MKPYKIIEPGLVDYKEAWDMQKLFFNTLLASKNGGASLPMALILLEHPHVYTMGIHGNQNNILFSPDMLKRIEASFYNIERGGDVTYHGPGQLVGYPILDLEFFKIGIKEYIRRLEEAVIKTVAHYGIKGEISENAVGVWVDSETPEARKICAIGVKVSRFITMHGFALNVTTDMEYYRHINPCGFIDKGVTSIEKETGLRPSVSEVSHVFQKFFEDLFR
jgi:lipoyl(octanoyl) transferase